MKATVTATRDAWVDQLRPKDGFQGERIWMRGDAGNQKRAYVYLPVPEAMKQGVTVKVATLRLYLKGTTWGGTQGITVQRVTSRWNARDITWNQVPSTTTTNQDTVSVVAGTEGQEVSIDLTALYQTVSSGGAYFGLRLSTDVAKNLRLHSSDSPDGGKRPELDLAWAKIPRPPNDLRPSSSHVVSSNRPTLLWNFRDRFGDTTQAAGLVEVATVAGALLYSSGMVTNLEEQFDLSVPPGGAPAFTALADGATAKWRVKAQDGDGLVSDFSDWSTFKYLSKGVLTITNPPGSTVPETTPPIAWSFTGRTQELVELTLFEFDTAHLVWKRIHRLPQRVQSVQSYTIPKNIITRRAHDYKLALKVWDTEDREDLPGAKAYASQTKVFQYVRDGTPNVPTGLTATVGATPAVTLTWSRASRPDWFALKVDDVTVEDRLDPDVVETTPGGTSYSVKYWGAVPGQLHTYDVIAVVNSSGVLKESLPATVTATTNPIGIWLVEPIPDISVVIMGQEQPSEALGESGSTFEPIGRRSPVRVTDSIRGYEGSISGELTDWQGVTAKTYRDRLVKIKGHVNTEEVRLIFGGRNFPVLLEEISVTPDPTGTVQVSIAYRQTGDFDAVRR